MAVWSRDFAERSAERPAVQRQCSGQGLLQIHGDTQNPFLGGTPAWVSDAPFRRIEETL